MVNGVQSYTSFVNFWMPFYKGYGLHDASWRGSFGGTIYYSSGSHGCINLPYNAAATLYEHTEVGTPVIVFGGY
jgi:lipoprotein-anchoring transpeptidase ErfK/SrfK